MRPQKYGYRGLFKYPCVHSRAILAGTVSAERSSLLEQFTYNPKCFFSKYLQIFYFYNL